MTDGEQGDAAAAKKRKLDSGAAVELSTPTPLDSENAAAANELDNENDEFVDGASRCWAWRRQCWATPVPWLDLAQVLGTKGTARRRHQCMSRTVPLHQLIATRPTLKIPGRARFLAHARFSVLPLSSLLSPFHPCPLLALPSAGVVFVVATHRRRVFGR